MMRSSFSISSMLLLSLVLSPFHASAAASFSDIGGHKNQMAVEWLLDHGMVTGYEDGTFRPEAGITRGELVKLLVEGAGVDMETVTVEYSECFSDIEGEWSEAYVCYAKEQGWIQGYSNGSFSPNRKVNKVEALKMVLNAQNVTVSESAAESPVTFEDASSSAWYAPYLATAQSKELLEQTTGNYGVADAMTRGEFSEILYRVILLQQYGFDTYSQYQEVLLSDGVTCDTPVQVFGDVAPDEGEMETVPVVVCKGYRYTACTQNPVGNVDLYGAKNAVTKELFEVESTDDVLVVLDGEGNKTEKVRPDCVTFQPDGSEYSLGVYGAEPDSSANIWITVSPLQEVPEGFEHSLVWFADSCDALTTEGYGPFNTPWGNDADVERPFYEGYLNYVHGGVDYECPVDTEVKAMCDGIIVDSNDAGGDWGWHTVLECEKNGKFISIAFIHIQQESALPTGTEVKAGDKIGLVFPLEALGEEVHVHLTACDSAYLECLAAGFQPQRGAARRSEWWGVRAFWFDMDWQDNPGLYETLPE